MSIVSVVRGPVYVLHAMLASSSAGRTICRYSLPRSCIPPKHAEQPNETRHADGVIHVRSSNWLDRGEEQDNADEAHPGDCNGVDWLAPPAHGIRSRDKLDAVLVDSMCDDDGNVADVERRGGDVEDGNNRQRAPDPDQVETAAEGYHEPYSVHGRSSDAVDLAPETVSHQPCVHRSNGICNLPRKGKGGIARECPRHSCIGQHGRATGEELHQDHEEPHDRPSGLSARVEKYLCHGETSRCGHDAFVICHAEAEGHGEHPSHESRH